MAPRNTLNRLTVKHLRALAALEDNMTLTRAASSLNLSQPALSNRLREIERLTDTQIFHREGSKLSFTALGTVLLNTARIVLDELNLAEAYLAKAGGSRRRTIRLEVWGYALHRWLVPNLAAFMVENPDISVDLAVSAAPLPQQALLAGEVDVSLAIGTTLRRGLTLHRLFGDALVGLVPKGHALTGKPFLDAADFAEGPFVTFSPALEKGQEVECFFLPAGVVPQWVVYAGSSDAVCAFVAAGFGLSILSHWVARQHEQADRFCCLPLTSSGLRADWHAVTRDDAATDPAVQRLVTALVRWGADLPG